jgi:hypothetical protein
VTKFSNLLLLNFRAKIERENRDIRLEQIKVEAAERRQTVLESIKYECPNVLEMFINRNDQCVIYYSGQLAVYWGQESIRSFLTGIR